MNKKIAEFIFSMCDMSVTSELPEEEQIESIIEDLKKLEGTNIYYYLSNACGNR